MESSQPRMGHIPNPVPDIKDWGNTVISLVTLGSCLTVEQGLDRKWKKALPPMEESSLSHLPKRDPG